jgi:hypothetical protein
MAAPAFSAVTAGSCAEDAVHGDSERQVDRCGDEDIDHRGVRAGAIGRDSGAPRQDRQEGEDALGAEGTDADATVK